MIVTVAGLLSTFPSFTTSDATYTPATSVVKVGIADVELDKTERLAVGLLVNVHLYVSLSPFASLLLLPSSVTGIPVVTLCATPALATGAAFAAAAVIVTVAGLL